MQSQVTHFLVSAITIMQDYVNFYMTFNNKKNDFVCIVFSGFVHIALNESQHHLYKLLYSKDSSKIEPTKGAHFMALQLIF